MRNPNGYGSVVNLGKGRRRPFGVRITRSYKVADDGTFKQKYEWLGYFRTKREAVQFLAKFNEKQRPIGYEKVTFEQAWEYYIDKYPLEEGSSRYSSYTAAYKKCEPLYQRTMESLKLKDLEDVLETLPKASASSINNIKIVMTFVFNWAIQNDIIDKNYAEMLDVKNYISKKTENHKRISTETVKQLWKDKDKYKLELMFIYTGVRANELLELHKADVDLSQQCFYVRKSKTRSGIRTVPIADCVLPFFKEYYEHSDGDLLVKISYQNYKKKFKVKLPGYTPHDTRVTCKSLLVEAKVQDIVSKKILGHNIGDVSGDIYTQLEPKALLEAVNSIPPLY